MPLLHPGDTFPQLTLNIPGAQAIQVPGWLAGEFGVHPVQIAQWKRQLVEASPAAFEAGGGRRDHAQAQLIEQLYQQIGQLKVEVDWLRKRGSARLP